jgi:hypothetical protein
VLVSDDVLDLEWQESVHHGLQDDALLPQMTWSDIQYLKVPGDGNCFYRAVCRGMSDPYGKVKRDIRGKAVQHRVAAKEYEESFGLRQQVVQYHRTWPAVLNSSETFPEDETPETWLVKQSEDGEWADQHAILATVEIIGRPILILCKNLNSGLAYEQAYWPVRYDADYESIITLRFDGELHYDLVDLGWLDHLTADLPNWNNEDAGHLVHKKPAAKASKAKASKPKPAQTPRLVARQLIKAVGAQAEKVDREVPLTKRHETTPPDTTYKSTRGHLDEERAWFLAGGIDPETQVPRRPASVSDATAPLYWDRFLYLVRFTDDALEERGSEKGSGKGVEKPSTVMEYLQTKFVQPWLQYYTEKSRWVEALAMEKPYTQAYIETLCRSIKAVAKTFVLPQKGKFTPEGQQYWDDLVTVCRNCKAKLRQNQPKHRDEVAVEDSSVPSGLVFLAKPVVNTSMLLARLENFEAKLSLLERKLAAKGRKQDMDTKKLRLKVAEHKRAHLAALLALWNTGRTKDLRLLVVNWDLRFVKIPGLPTHAVVDPCEFKTKYMKSDADLKEEPGKILHPKVRGLLDEYLTKWRDVLVRNLGKRSQYEPRFNDTEHGTGAEQCFTLFPGYWPDNQSKTFTDENLVKVLDAKERVIRKALGVSFTDDLIQKWGVDEVAVYQQFHHSGRIHKENYLRGRRNEVNGLQSFILKWGPMEAVSDLVPQSSPQKRKRPAKE